MSNPEMLWGPKLPYGWLGNAVSQWINKSSLCDKHLIDRADLSTVPTRAALTVKLEAHRWTVGSAMSSFFLMDNKVVPIFLDLTLCQSLFNICFSRWIISPLRVMGIFLLFTLVSPASNASQAHSGCLIIKNFDWLHVHWHENPASNCSHCTVEETGSESLSDSKKVTKLVK